MPRRKAKSKRAPVAGFMTLPPELRCLVYPYMLAAGTTAILRTSKTIYNEGKSYLYKSAFLRLHIKSFQQSPNSEWRLIPRTSWFTTVDLGLVQNVELKIDQNHLYAYDQQDLGTLGHFLYSSNDVPRKTCHVRIKNMTDSRYTLRRVSNALCGLYNFESIYITITVGRLPSDSPQYSLDRNEVAKQAYHTIAGAIPHTLGLAIWQPDKSDGGGYLAFRPRETKLG
ncbi:hypothetical protein N7G274_008412 [Stereocaulon virgatum]|uniref:LAGLIDADG homing endonuclease n=1 Tax=Stereocaulon virgatum TaxID=373712 RepID=A0ABR4A0A1_9LECA